MDLTSPPPHPSHASFPIIAVAVIGILATAFLLVSYYIFVIKCCLNWHRIDLLRRFSFSRTNRAQHPATAYSPAVENRGLNEAAIRSIPIFKFKKATDDEREVLRAKSPECAVCLNEFQDDEKLRVIPNCAHVFHIDCIDVWLQSNANCPLCRTSISAAWPEARFPADQARSQDPDPLSGNFTGRDEDYVVIEIGPSEQGRVRENPNSNEHLPNSPWMRKVSGKRGKKFSHVCSMGDEWIDCRMKDEQFVVQPIRRSFSMDSAADSQLYLAVQEIIMQANNPVNSNEGCSSSSSRGAKRMSFFSFGHGRGSRSAVQTILSESFIANQLGCNRGSRVRPILLEPQGLS